MSRALIVDDDPTMCGMLRANLVRRDYDPVTCGSADEALALLKDGTFDVVVTDLNMRGTNGLELCARVVAERPDLPVIVITAFGNLEAAIGAIRAGAYDFLPKPFEIDALVVALDRAVQHRSLREEVKRLRRALGDTQRFDELVGDSASMQKLYKLIDRVSATEAPVLITGESGTGKELVARSLHRRSRRAAHPFVAINCAAVPESMLESELFGHVRGAFTDARSTRTGLFAQAEGGTLFLDEIGELPPGLQPKLLRALQERKIRPLGADAEIDLDVRLITATNRDLETAVEEQRFREDLYYRIHVVQLDLPPLRARGNDVLLLAQHFLEHAGAVANRPITGLSLPAAEKLLAYAWPGNVRELHNTIERAVAMGEHAQIMLEDLPDKIRSHRRSHVVVASDDPSELVSMEEVERRYIQRVVEAVRGNKTEAARILGFDRTTLYRKLEKYGVDPKREA